MNWETDGRSPAVKAWYQALCEQSALLDGPEDYTQALCVQANALHAAGEVEAAELGDMLQAVDAGYSWAVEELLTRELNPSADT
ncbi:hypothetical protein [Pseudomonas syringae group genomosp. 3]|uniref:hypothetical protein n=1 Tax=Pseudomonas syringae group genomosp. 3 TaxID=251701 RepID=UPI000EFC3518|nr:hypothetical protein [Pseudomonas syringae group genomosp. 3]